MNARNARTRQKRGLPWFRDFDGCWYATINGVRHKLAKGEGNKEEALKEWHRLSLLANAEQSKEANPCWVIFEHYLDHVQRHHSSCYSRYRETFQSFKDHHGDLRVNGLTVRQVHAWLDAHPNWGDSTRSLVVAVICSALNWAAKPEQGLLDQNPIRGMKRPSIRSRGAEAVIDPEDFRQLYETVNDRMKEVLLFLRQTGTRPVNLTRITAETVDWANRCVRLTVHKT
jgi:hypothetical protein